MALSEIKKVYDLKIIGGDTVLSTLDAIHNKFREGAALKKDYDKQFKEGAITATQYREAVNKLKLEEAAYTVELKKKQVEMQNVMIATAKLTQEQISNDNLLTTQSINNSKKRAAQDDAEIKASRLRVQEALEQKRKLAIVSTRNQNAVAAQSAQPGTYFDILNQYNEKSRFVKANIGLSSPEIDKAKADLFSLKSQLDDFNRSLTRDKLLVGEYTTGIAQAFDKLGLGGLVKDHISAAKQQIQTLNTEFERLGRELKAVGDISSESGQKLQSELIANRRQVETLTSHVQQFGGIGTQVMQGLKNEFASLKGMIAQFTISYLGFQALISATTKSVEINKHLSDSFADLKIRMKGTDEDVNHLVDSLKKLETRTSLTQLVDISAIVAKKGIAKDEIAGVTDAINKLMVALGTEIGDPHEAVSSLVKITNMFSEDKHVTANGINEIGGAIAKLTTSGVATGPFLIDFAERLGALRGVTGITIDKVLGLGAAMEELGQRTETSGTAMSQLLLKLFTNTKQYAELLHVSQDQFTRMLGTDALDVLVKVAAAIKGNTGEMAKFFENVQEMETKGARVIGVLGDMAGNFAYVRKRMTDATAALADHSLLTDMATQKEHTFAAEIEKLQKRFEVMAANPVFQWTLSAIVTLLGALTTSLYVVIPLLGLLGAAWTVVNYQIIRAKVIGVVTAALELLTGAVTAATGATTLFATALSLMVTPVGLIITAIALLTAGTIALTYAMSGNTNQLRAMTVAMRANYEITGMVNKATAEQVSKLDTLNKVLKSNIASLDTKQKALQELQSQYDSYKDVLIDETGKVTGLDEAYKKAAASIRAFSEAKASGDLAAQKLAKVMQITSLRQRVEAEAAIQQGQDTNHKVSLDGLSDEEKAMLDKISGNRNLKGDISRTFSGGRFFLSDDAKAISDALKVEEDAANKIYQTYSDIAAKKKEALGGGKAEVMGAHGEAEDEADRKAQIGKRLLELDQWFEDYDKSFRKHTGAERAMYEKYKKEKQQLQKELDGLLGFGHVRGSGDDLTKVQLDADKRLAEAKKKTFDEQKKQEMEGLKAIYDDESVTLHKRIAAYVDYAAIKKAILDSDYQAEVGIIKNRLAQIEQIEQAQQTKPSKRTAEQRKFFDKYGNIKFADKSLLIGKDADEAQLDTLTAKHGTDTAALAQETDKSLQGIYRTSYDKQYASLDAELARRTSLITAKYNSLRENVTGSKDSQDNKDDKLGKLSTAEEAEKSTAALEVNGQKQLNLQAQLQNTAIAFKITHNAQLVALEKSLQDELKRVKQEAVDLTRKKDDDQYNRTKSDQEKTKELKKQAEEGAFQVAQEFANSYMQLLQQEDEYKQTMARRQLDWNKKLLDSQTQSKQQQLANDKAYYLEQQQLEKQKMRDDRNRAMTTLLIDSVLAAGKVVATEITNTPKMFVDLGVIAATLAAKEALLATAPMYAEGIATTTPKYAAGTTTSHPGGPAWVGDGYESELLKVGRNFFLSPSRPTLVNLPQGAQVAPLSRYQGVLGAGLTPPQFVADHYMRKAAANTSDISGVIAAMQAQHNELVYTVNSRIDRLTVSLDPNNVTSYQSRHAKNVSIGQL